MSVKQLFIAACVLASAQTALPLTGWDFTFSADAGAARMDGTSCERVYVPINHGALAGRDHRLSELVWDLDGVYGVRASAAAEVFKSIGFGLRAEGFYALTDGNGGMADYDWFLYDRPDYWTHRSRSTVEVRDTFGIDIRGTIRLLRKAGVTLDGALGWRQLTFGWKDRGIDYTYSSLGATQRLPPVGYTYEQLDPGAVRDMSGTDDSNGIIYSQTFRIPYAGFGAGYQRGRLRARAEVAYSPVASAEDEDQHILRDRVFKGTFDGGTYFAWKGSLDLMLSRRVFVSASCGAERISEFRGDMTVFDANGSYVGAARDGASVEHKSRQVAVSVGMEF